MTAVVEYRVMLPDGRDLTYKSLVRPTPGGGPYLSQEGTPFFAERIEGNVIWGWSTPR